MKNDVLHKFISPVTGKIDGIYQFPDLQAGYVWFGNDLNRPFPTLLSDIITLPSLANGNIWIGDSNNKPVANPTILQSNLPNLAQNNIWIGDTNSRPTPSKTIGLNNLPPLNTVSIAGYPTPLPQTYAGTSSGVPEISNSFAEAIADIFLINAKLLVGNFIMGDAIVQATWPGAQFLVNLEDGMLKKTGKTLQHAVPGTDYMPGVSDPPYQFAEANLLIYGDDRKVYRSPAQFVDAMGAPDSYYFRNGIIRALRIQARREGEAVPEIGCEGLITGESIGTRLITLFDSKEVHRRRDDGITLVGPTPALPDFTMHRWYMPQKISTLGQVLKDVGGSPDVAYPAARTLGFGSVLPDNLQDGLLAQKKDENQQPQIINATLTNGKIWQGNEQNVPIEVNTAPLDATYILQTPYLNGVLSKSQSLSSLLGGGILKIPITNTGVIEIASGGKIPIENDYVRPIDLQEEIEAVLAEATAAGAEAGATAGTTAGTAAGTIAGTEAGATAGATAGTASGAIAGTAAVATKLAITTYVETISAGTGIKVVDNSTFGIHKEIVVSIDNNPIIPGKGGILIPTGTTADRLSNPHAGVVRFNIDL